MVIRWYRLLLFAAFYLFNGTSGIRAYYFSYVVGDINKFGTFSMLQTLLMMVVIFITPSVIKKLGKSKTVIFGLIIFTIANLLILVNPTDAACFTVMACLANIGTGALTAVIYTYIADLTDYIREKTGVMAPTFVGMCSSVGTKIGTVSGSF